MKLSSAWMLVLAVSAVGCADPVDGARHAVRNGRVSSIEGLGTLFSATGGPSCPVAAVDARHVLGIGGCLLDADPLTGSVRVDAGEDVPVLQVFEGPAVPINPMGATSSIVVLRLGSDLPVSPLALSDAPMAAGDRVRVVGLSSAGADPTEGDATVGEPLPMVPDIREITADPAFTFESTDGFTVNASGALAGVNAFVFGGTPPDFTSVGAIDVASQRAFLDESIATPPQPDAGPRDAGGARDSGPDEDGGGCRVGRGPGVVPSWLLFALAALLLRRRESAFRRGSFAAR